ncbi:GAF domain-containing protein, partial [Acidobacteriota bacterium]
MKKEELTRYRDFYDVVMSCDLSSARSLLVAIMDKIIEITNSEIGILVLFEKGEIMIPVARSRSGRSMNTIRKPFKLISRQVLERAARERKLIITEDVLSDPNLEYTQSLKELNIRSLMLAPLWHKRKMIGLVYVDRRASKTRYDAGAVKTFQNFSEDMGRLIYNTIEQERRKQRLEVLEQSLELPGIV